jgi:translation initiation factor 2B subunit (eIF-2B alpha/beta/delta family)
MNVLSQLDEVTHRSPEDKLYQNLAALVKHLPDDPVTHNLVSAVLAAAKFGHKESVLERIQRCKAALRSAETNAQATLVHRIKKGSAIALLPQSELIDVVERTKAALHIIGHAASSVHATVYEPLAARQAVKQADLVIIPVIAITSEKIIAPIGSELLVELAVARGIPAYAFATGFQFTKHLETVPGATKQCFVSHGHQKRCVATYEAINPNAINIISELGIFSHARFIDELSHAYPWLWV